MNQLPEAGPMLMRRTGMRRIAMLAIAVLIGLSGAFDASSSPTRAQDYSGWYGPFDDGCYYWWDGYQYTGDVDCNGDGYADSASGSNAASGAAAGWYGPFDDGCNYWWDGT